MGGDVVTLETDVCPGEPLLLPVMKDGCRVTPKTDIEKIRDHALAGIGKLPPRLRALERSEQLPVEISSQLKALAAEADRIGLPTAPI
jgi:nicotinate phosphoribosyltransferase